jgi:hypothetical protein
MIHMRRQSTAIGRLDWSQLGLQMSGIGALPSPAAGRKTLQERPVFGIMRPLSNTRGIRGSRGGNIPIERRWGDTEAMSNLSYGDVRIGEQRLGGLDAVIREFRRTASGAAKASRSGKQKATFGPWSRETREC